MLPEDPILDEIRRVRHRISAQFNHDPFKLVEYYMKLQEANQDRLISPAKGNLRGELSTPNVTVTT